MVKYNKTIRIANFAKVGTHTVTKSLKKGYIKKSAHSTHVLKLWNNGQKNDLIIVGFREFVGRNMSYFFQTFCSKIYNDVKHKGNNYKGERGFVGTSKVLQKMETISLAEIFFKRG